MIQLRASLCAAAALVLAAAVPALAQSSRDAFAAEAEVERALLRQDLADYRTARTAEETARIALDGALAEYDEALRGSEPALAAVETAAAAVTAATARAEAEAMRSERLRESIRERLRALAVLGRRGGAEAAAVPAGGIDLTGRWRVAVSPGGLMGTFRLDQDGAVVAGTYTLTDGSGGSLRGSVSGERVRLERVDRSSGFDSIWEGEIDPARRRIDGRWSPTILSSGGPGGGTWAAVPADSPAADTLRPAEPAGGVGLEEDLDEEDLDEEDLDEEDLETDEAGEEPPPEEEPEP